MARGSQASRGWGQLFRLDGNQYARVGRQRAREVGPVDRERGRAAEAQDARGGIVAAVGDLDGAHERAGAEVDIGRLPVERTRGKGHDGLVAIADDDRDGPGVVHEGPEHFGGSPVVPQHPGDRFHHTALARAIRFARRLPG